MSSAGHRIFMSNVICREGCLHLLGLWEGLEGEVGEDDGLEFFLSLGYELRLIQPSFKSSFFTSGEKEVTYGPIAQ